MKKLLLLTTFLLLLSMSAFAQEGETDSPAGSTVCNEVANDPSLKRPGDEIEDNERNTPRNNTVLEAQGGE